MQFSSLLVQVGQANMKLKLRFMNVSESNEQAALFPNHSFLVT